MKAFYEAYRDEPKLSTLVREISWTNNLSILTRCNTTEEKEFYLRLSAKENYSSRELERQISTSVFERTLLGNQKLSAVLRELHPAIEGAFRDSYIFEFLNLSEPFSESDLQNGLIRGLKDFILELGKDFSLRRRKLPASGRQYGLFHRPSLLSSKPAMPDRFRTQNRQIQARISWSVKLLSRSTGP